MKRFSKIALLLLTLFVVGNCMAQEGPKAEKPTKLGLFKRLRQNRMSISDKGTSKGTLKKTPAVVPAAK